MPRLFIRRLIRGAESSGTGDAGRDFRMEEAYPAPLTTPKNRVAMPTVKFRAMSVDLTQDERQALIQQIHRMIRSSVGPYRSPTSQELRERLTAVAQVLPEVATELDLSDDQTCAVFEAFVSGILETRLRERLSGTLEEGWGRTSGRMTGGYDYLALADG